MKVPILLNGSSIVDDNFLEQTSHNVPVKDSLEIKNSGEGDLPRLDEIKNSLNVLRDKYENNKPKIDGEAAKMIHKLLPLERREANNHKFWHYLTVCECPDYVAWRHFDGNKGKVNKERYLGRWDGNALGRLWWWAAFTYDPASNDNYHRTLTGATSQEFMLHSVDNLLGGNSYLLNSIYDIVFNEEKRLPDRIIRKLFVRVNATLVTVSVDSLPEKDIVVLVKRIYESLNEKHK